MIQNYSILTNRRDIKLENLQSIIPKNPENINMLKIQFSHKYLPKVNKRTPDRNLNPQLNAKSVDR